ncbi:G-type lectin S-receptor-like serine/threonine-protein kinase At2g19130 isoform X3 [Arachis ipaensis]|uniref:G-type lectin S-receptor-like serine/threonine-protein kinase At2g19130 isoform X3 n=1 Tax=Arachis ipaensis TaxID=130454 RepID=UPI0007AFD16F|nr:G-type lectin S-receptor-like serine/threonine-protein kinase At2g19130 isoform X3 [Arachis ipaensis]XP_025643464.1 G-type lectin S-receptor-like serine/threonine-protein kinase At2g19130 isoform X3 [Arachis hypogaea]XP_025643465.1 G-type lectin S-receptor-like serine/threonine-protein kinase At2g19130 isoform X3 [Arachis hypogaea]QHO00319.1 G-type lectin S-receptor-like serine/threonine-protein kinase [Arachis hypogaea]
MTHAHPGQRLSGNQTLVSYGQIFEMGFFSPSGSGNNSRNYYLGIWYKGLPTPERTVVWVANRDHPISDPYSSWLELDKHGNLSLYTSTGHAVWSANSSFSLDDPLDSKAAKLREDGNFIISSSFDKYDWQSFDYPTDTLLPNAYLEYDNDRGIKRVLKSWLATSNPSTGNFSAEVTTVSVDLAEVQLLQNDGFTESKFCINRFHETKDYVYDFEFHFIGYVDIYSYVLFSYGNSYNLARYVLDGSGKLKLLGWSNEWVTINMDHKKCDFHGRNEDTRVNAKHSGRKNATWVVVEVAIGLTSVMVAIAILLIRLWKRGTTTSSKVMGGDTLKQYNYRDLRKATRNFTIKLGNGGFSTVYKGEFPDSTFVAVKELRGHFQEEKQLRAELNTVGLIQHKNLVRLLGFCLQGSQRFIIYDYMPNGSLESHLFQSDSNVLDWGTRYNIALGTAKGLAYLHEHCRDCIIHCDIKPENILLDAEFNPQVADFGLAKLLGRDFSRVLTTMRGTRGYLATEWFSGVPITAKVDVYSYGQVLLEIISGRRNMDLVNDDLASYFPSIVFNALNNGEDVLPLVDSKLQGKFSAEEVNRACKVGCWCIQDDENDRPTMKEVVQALEGNLDVGIPPIPQFFLSLAEPSVQKGDLKESKDYSTSSTLPSSFSFQAPVHQVQDEP